MLEKVKAVRELLTNNWTQGAMARDEAGKAVDAMDESACKWCLMGACAKVTNQYQNFVEYVQLCDIIANSSGFITLVSFNDTAQHEAVLDLLDNVIRRLENAA